MKHLILSLALGLSVVGSAFGQDKKVVLFPNGAPGETEKLIEKSDDTGAKTGGEKVTRITNISSPEITIYPADQDIASGAAMVVCPGGGYGILAYDKEGTEVCKWLNETGVTAILLKYRVPRREGREKHEAPLQDVQRAISYVRAHSEEMGIDADRIGVMPIVSV